MAAPNPPHHYKPKRKSCGTILINDLDGIAKKLEILELKREYDVPSPPLSPQTPPNVLSDKKKFETLVKIAESLSASEKK